MKLGMQDRKDCRASQDGRGLFTVPPCPHILHKFSRIARLHAREDETVIMAFCGTQRAAPNYLTEQLCFLRHYIRRTTGGPLVVICSKVATLGEKSDRRSD